MSTPMSPRPYNLGKRQVQISHGRRQILHAARALLAEATSYIAFTVDAVAKRADVARATVYYQFGSKTGLLEAVCDDLADVGQMSELAQAFTTTDPAQALRAFVTAFARFWDVDRNVMRRLRALAALDTEVAAVIAARDQRRREGLQVLVGRLATGGVGPIGSDRDRAVRILLALTSFETFDALAAPSQDLLEVVSEVVSLTQAALQGDPAPQG